jgi:hypothetical protein
MNEKVNNTHHPYDPLLAKEGIKGRFFVVID